MLKKVEAAEEFHPGPSQIDLGEEEPQGELETVVVKKENLKIPKK